MCGSDFLAGNGTGITVPDEVRAVGSPIGPKRPLPCVWQLLKYCDVIKVLVGSKWTLQRQEAFRLLQ